MGEEMYVVKRKGKKKSIVCAPRQFISLSEKYAAPKMNAIRLYELTVFFVFFQSVMYR
jgi:hypothetical protein